ncbi:hypothetical protein PRK78_000622 [Emydomyces testavorans]|uniref:Uncharacterized protein n=1 Tax=Emydomyces testavorans TaxID=2070801 RepID=A0AAF0DBF0_9EURO|nr:hypothetical protein PRK78_000622 [Emydomyces testavorans]
MTGAAKRRRRNGGNNNRISPNKSEAEPQGMPIEQYDGPSNQGPTSPRGRQPPAPINPGVRSPRANSPMTSPRILSPGPSRQTVPGPLSPRSNVQSLAGQMVDPARDRSRSSDMCRNMDLPWGFSSGHISCFGKHR